MSQISDPHDLRLVLPQGSGCWAHFYLNFWIKPVIMLNLSPPPRITAQNPNYSQVQISATPGVPRNYGPKDGTPQSRHFWNKKHNNHFRWEPNERTSSEDSNQRPSKPHTCAVNRGGFKKTPRQIGSQNRLCLRSVPPPLRGGGIPRLLWVQPKAWKKNWGLF